MTETERGPLAEYDLERERLVEIEPTEHLVERLDAINGAIEAAEAMGAIVPGVILADRDFYAQVLLLARERDERLAERWALGQAYSQCWCLGTGGRHRVGLAVRSAGGRLVSAGQSVYAETCTCPEGQAHEAVKRAARADLRTQLDERITQALATQAHVPQRYQQSRLAQWAEGQRASGADAAVLDTVVATLGSWWANVQENARKGSALPCLLVLIGDYGEGKTTLAVAALRRWLEEGREGLMWSTQELLDQVRGTTAATATYATKRVPLLVLDDLGAEALGERQAAWAIPLLLDLLSFRQAHCLPTVITTNLDTSEIAERLGGRVAERVLTEEVSLAADLRGLVNLRGSRR